MRSTLPIPSLSSFRRNRLGRVAEKRRNALWFFYRKSLKHGSELSHFPVVSTLFRLIYMYFFLLVIPYLVLSSLMPGAWDIVTELRWWFIKIFEHWQIVIGLIGSDLIHWGLDVLTTEHKSANSRNKKSCSPIF